ncbi:MAG: rhomboid family intramembrane serine protease [Bacteroidia bacterium]|nr:rhomboid family intramembrane serine protease [Bacteroidia bacterium]MDW8157732.1 rhomboid family intramembrane serine protease [Bacteroidia bacterium]
MQSIIKDIRNDFLPKLGAFGYLILINSIVFLVIILVQLIGLLFQIPFHNTLIDIINYFLALSTVFPDYLFKPWTFLSYNFVHYQPFHLLFNLVVLYFIGSIGRQFFSDRQVYLTYLLGGLSGGILVVISYMVLPYFSNQAAYCVGASAGIYALMVAMATLVPNYPVYLLLVGRISLKWLAVIYILLDLVFLATGGNKGGHITHIGGAIWGYLWVVYRKKGIDISQPFIFICDKLEALRQRRYNRNGMRIVKDKPVSEEELNRILDKIRAVGYDKLTAKEKETLHRAGKQ